MNRKKYPCIGTFLLLCSIIQATLEEHPHEIPFSAQQESDSSDSSLEELGIESELATQFLPEAARQGNRRLVIRYLRAGADIHVQNDEPLRQALVTHQWRTVKLLIYRGANIHMDDDLALRQAARAGHLPMVRFLLAHDANIHANQEEPLTNAIAQGHWHIVEYLLRREADLISVLATASPALQCQWQCYQDRLEIQR